MSLSDILHSIEDAVTGGSHDDQPQNVDPSADPVYDGDQGIKSSSQDPYGDPADQQGQILSSSQDPYGDPADKK